MTDLLPFASVRTHWYDALVEEVGDPFAPLQCEQEYLEKWCSLWYTHEPASTRPVPDYEYLERLQALAWAKDHAGEPFLWDGMPAPSLLVDPAQVSFEWSDQTAEIVLSPGRQALAAVKEPLALEAGRP